MYCMDGWHWLSREHIFLDTCSFIQKIKEDSSLLHDFYTKHVGSLSLKACDCALKSDYRLLNFNL